MSSSLPEACQLPLSAWKPTVKSAPSDRKKMWRKDGAKCSFLHTFLLEL